MNLVPCIGYRAAYTRKEVEKFTGMSKDQVKKRIVARGSSPYWYLQSDVNEFLTKLNAGKLTGAAK